MGVHFREKKGEVWIKRLGRVSCTGPQRIVDGKRNQKGRQGVESTGQGGLGGKKRRKSAPLQKGVKESPRQNKKMGDWTRKEKNILGKRKITVKTKAT